MKKQVYAYFNHGRWLAACPKHEFGNKSRVDPLLNRPFIPPCCYPGMNRVIPGKAGLQLDRSARKTAQAEAEKNDDLYEVVFPENWLEIEQALEGRPDEAKNWTPGETLGLLQVENVANGVDNP